MKVKDLIKELQTFPGDMDVAMWRHENMWESVNELQLIKDALITSCIVDDEKRKKEGKEIESFVGLMY